MNWNNTKEFKDFFSSRGKIYLQSSYLCFIDILLMQAVNRMGEGENLEPGLEVQGKISR